MMLACRCGARFEDVTALLRHARIDHRVTTHWRPHKAPGELVKRKKILTDEGAAIVAWARAQAVRS